MSLVLPSELVVERFLPTFRAMLATRLAKRGMTQKEIASHLGVTQAAISTYVGGDAGGDTRFQENQATVAAAERIADGLTGGEMDGYDALAELLSLIRHLEDRGPICEAHETVMPELNGLGCDLCVRGFDANLTAERSVLQNVREAARTLATTPNMAALVPNVGTNVGMALAGATDATAVAAIPGRIYTIGGRVEVPANPEFGASKHVATAILAAIAIDPETRGAVNIATDDDVLGAVRNRGIDPLEFDADYENRSEQLEACFDHRSEVPRVAYHRGAFGIEPTTYVFGSTALDAAQFVRGLASE